jgi:type II secretory pathway component PulJ
MKNILFIGALVVSLGLIGFLYQQLTTTQEVLKAAEQRFTDCQQVTFQLQNQLAQAQRQAKGDTTRNSLGNAGR